ncbi:Piezo-type mechanosensitive ion channel component 2, partial [Varanus komodoensis]
LVPCSQESEAETEDGTEDEETDGSFETDSLGRSQSDILLKLTLFLEGLKILCEGVCRAADQVMAVLLLGIAGIILPSAASAVYFLIFLGLCSWWSCHRRISPDAFHSLYVSIAIFSAGHLFVLYLYQLPFFQDLVPPEDIHVR